MVESKYVTFIGDICVAVNPFAPHPFARSKAWVQYNASKHPESKHYRFDDYIKCAPDDNGDRGEIKALEPHCWTVADQAYTTMQSTRPWKDQAVLICGESGAGKTECCKFVLDYLLAKKGSAVEKLTDKLIATNEPLECFGDAS